MIDVKRIFPECHADTLLVELILQRGTPKHFHGINNVGIALMKYPKNDFIIGIIDTDKFKRKDPNIELFTTTISDKLHDEKLIIKQQPKTNKYIIRLAPEFEPWVWELAKKCNIAPGDFGFDTIKKLKNVAKDENAAANKNLKKFLNAIIQANPPAIQTLRYWLSKATTENNN